MKAYSTIKPRFWSRGTGRQLSPHAKLLALYLVTSPGSNYYGIYALSQAQACADTGLSLEELTAAFAELRTEGFARWDVKEDVVWVLNAVAHAAPGAWSPVSGWSPSHAKGAAKALDIIGEHPLCSAFTERYPLKKSERVLSVGTLPPTLPPTLDGTLPTTPHLSLSLYSNLNPSLDPNLDPSSSKASFNEEVTGHDHSKARANSGTSSLIADDWAPSPETVGAIEMRGRPASWVTAQVEQFRLWHQSKGDIVMDWDKAFQLWCTRGIIHEQKASSKEGVQKRMLPNGRYIDAAGIERNKDGVAVARMAK